MLAIHVNGIRHWFEFIKTSETGEMLVERLRRFANSIVFQGHFATDILWKPQPFPHYDKSLNGIIAIGYINRGDNNYLLLGQIGTMFVSDNPYYRKPQNTSLTLGFIPAVTENFPSGWIHDVEKWDRALSDEKIEQKTGGK